MTELYAALQPVLDEHESFHRQQSEEDQEGKERSVQLAIMGLPNVVGSHSQPTQHGMTATLCACTCLLRLSTLACLQPGRTCAAGATPGTPDHCMSPWNMFVLAETQHTWFDNGEG